MKARLHPIWVGGRAGYVYSVICDGQLIVSRSLDPECDAARALLAQGITGELALLDGTSHHHRHRDGCHAHDRGNRGCPTPQKVP